MAEIINNILYRTKFPNRKLLIKIILIEVINRTEK